MNARTDSRSADHEAVVVNRDLTIEVTLDEILEDLLFPATRASAGKRTET